MLWMALQLGVSHAAVSSALLTQTHGLGSTAQPHLQVTSAGSICWQCWYRQRNSSYCAHSLNKLVKKHLKYFLNVHLSLISLAFQALFCSKFSPSCLCFRTATAVSGPAFKGRTLLSAIHCSSVSIIHFALVTAIIPSETRNGGKQNHS